jgi:hypothetical protein
MQPTATRYAAGVNFQDFQKRRLQRTIFLVTNLHVITNFLPLLTAELYVHSTTNYTRLRYHAYSPFHVTGTVTSLLKAQQT